LFGSSAEAIEDFAIRSRPPGGSGGYVDKSTLKQKAYREFKEFLVIAAYLWVVLGLFLLYKSVILNQEHIQTFEKGFALINALALAKVALVARALHLGEQVDDAPLIYPTLLKSALFALVLAAFKILEEFLVGLYHHKTFLETMSEIGGGTLKGILTLTLILFVMLIPFFAFGEASRVLGKDKLRQLFLHSRSVTNWEMTESEIAPKA
jgi:hypothetical protein